ncbi:unnamed protein product [Gordionus sp. m RMFG-2023]
MKNLKNPPNDELSGKAKSNKIKISKSLPTIPKDESSTPPKSTPETNENSKKGRSMSISNTVKIEWSSSPKKHSFKDSLKEIFCTHEPPIIRKINGAQFPPNTFQISIAIMLTVHSVVFALVFCPQSIYQADQIAIYIVSN